MRAALPEAGENGAETAALGTAPPRGEEKSPATDRLGRRALRLWVPPVPTPAPMRPWTVLRLLSLAIVAGLATASPLAAQTGACPTGFEIPDGLEVTGYS